jgi:L-ascorbate metabolism protein UlaG (beta-lactamase superfamily)
VRLTWLGHATCVLEIDGVRLLTDPLLRRTAGPLLRRGPVPEPSAWKDPSAVLISHLHHDHVELASLRMLGDVPLVTGPENARFLERRRLHAVALGDEWWPVPGGDAQVRLVRADHHSRPMPHRPNAAHGHLVRGDGHIVWFAGDTSLYHELADLPDLAGGPIDLAVVPIGGWGPRLSGGHMGPREAARACERVGARNAVAYHWGTFRVPGMDYLPRGWMDVPGLRFPLEVDREAPGCRALALRPGESTEL